MAFKVPFPPKPFCDGLEVGNRTWRQPIGWTTYQTGRSLQHEARIEKLYACKKGI